ncbi:MAG: putative DNA modification/repair radical SAM protein [Oscillospiraceae bacterium]|nr:putative DNA modification/repair radical SAM protein [Oscillospiraceae bacterium]
MNLAHKLEILGAAARYDVSCSSSGSNRQNSGGTLGNAAVGGICHSWTADGRCVSLLKVLMSNYCIYDCAYCANRASLDKERAAFTPRELADLTIDFYRRNYIEGLFLSSGVLKSPDHTSEIMMQALEILRNEYRFSGYIHVKIIPGTDSKLVDKLSSYADRVSCNIELPSSASLNRFAPQKLPEHIFAPMKYIKQGHQQYLEDGRRKRGTLSKAQTPQFAPAGQTTQMIIGASADTDLTILTLSKNLYKRFSMKRVYYSAYIPNGTHAELPPADTPVPLTREHRIYQADFLMRFYYFEPDELLDDANQSLQMDVDPKCDWALRHPEEYPIEVNTAPLERLLRIPGVGTISANRIIEARRMGGLRLEDLRKLGVVMKRAQFFLTANGKFGGILEPGHPMLRGHMVDGTGMAQLSLFNTPDVLRLANPGAELTSPSGKILLPAAASR